MRRTCRPGAASGGRPDACRFDQKGDTSHPRSNCLSFIIKVYSQLF